MDNLTLDWSDCVFCKYTPKEIERELDAIVVREMQSGMYGVSVKVLDNAYEYSAPETDIGPGMREGIFTAWRKKLDKRRKDARASNERCVNFTDPACRKKRAPSSAQPESPPLPEHNARMGRAWETPVPERTEVDTPWFDAVEARLDSLKSKLKSTEDRVDRIAKESSDKNLEIDLLKGEVVELRDSQFEHAKSLFAKIRRLRKACRQMNQSVDRKNMRIAQLEMKEKGK